MAAALLAHVLLLTLGVNALGKLLLDSLPERDAVRSVALRVRQLPAVKLETLAPDVTAMAWLPAEPVRHDPGAALEPVLEPVPEAIAALPAPQQIVDIHIPRALLSVAPVARGPVLLNWPPNWPLKANYTAVLKLFLDEHGQVERVEPDGEPVLPQPLLDSARKAFTAAGFTPGQLNGQAVKSWIRVEVSFETETVGRPP